MPNLSEKDVLRRLEMLARIKPEAEATEQAMDKVRETLLSGALQGPPAKPRIVQLWQQPWVKMAVAACLVVAMTWGGMHWLGSGTGETGPVAMTGGGASSATRPVMPTDHKRLAALLLDERREIETFVNNGDVSGLMRMLTAGQPESQALAAGHLADLGDEQALELLQSASDRWIGNPAENPFKRAMARIAERGDTRIAAVGPKEAMQSTQPTITTEETTTTAFSDSTGRGVLRGMVKDASGQPIAGLSVELIGSYIDQVVTDANGLYAFDIIMAGTYRLRTRSTQYLDIQTETGDELMFALDQDSQVVKDLTLQSGCQVDVEVVDEAGEPVSNAVLLASWMGSDQDNDVGLKVLTDAQGRAEIGAFKSSDFAYMITAVHPNYACARETVKCHAQQDPPPYVQIVLRRGVDVQGMVFYADGTPAKDLQVSAQPNWWQNQTVMSRDVPVNPDGSFTLTGIVPGSYGIRVGGEDYQYQVSQARLPLPAADPLMLTVPGSASQNDQVIEGRVAFSQETTNPRLTIVAYDAQGGGIPQQLTTENGRFELKNLKKGTYTLAFSGPTVRDRVIEGIPAPTLDLDVALEVVDQPVIAGVVLTDSSKSVVENFRIALVKKQNLPGLNYLPQETWHRFNDSQGQFRIEPDSPGVYQVQVWADGFVPTRIDQVDTDQAEALYVNMSRGGVVSGQVLTTRGLPVSEAQVRLLLSQYGDELVTQGWLASQDQIVKTDAQGHFQIEHVSEGLYSLKVEHPLYSTTYQSEVMVQDERVTGPLSLTMQPGASLEGYVFDAEGKPEANVTLVVQDAADRGHAQNPAMKHLATVVTDEQGYYQVAGLPESLCFVQRRDWSRVQGVVRQAVLPVAGDRIRMDLGGAGRVEGSIVVDDHVLAHHRVLIADRVNPYCHTFQCFGQTDDQGRFAMNGVPVGEFGVYISDLGTFNHWIKVGQFQMGTSDLDLGQVPQQLCTVEVTVSSVVPEAAEGWQVRLVSGDPGWGDPVGLNFAAERHAQLQVIDRVIPGTYTLIATSPDGLRELQETLSIPQDASVHRVALEVPTGPATVSGVMVESLTPTPVLFSEDHGLMVRLETQDDFFFVKGLPTGRYYVGNPYLREKAPLLAFEVTADEPAFIDVNPRTWSNPGQGMLSVLVTDASNIPIPAAQTWLEGPEGRIDPIIRTDREQIFAAAKGTYRLYASFEGLKTRHMEVTIEANDAMALYPERSLVQMRLEAP